MKSGSRFPCKALRVPSDCLIDPEKSYRTLTGNLTEIHKIFWAAFTWCFIAMNKTSLFASSASHLVALSSLTLLVNSTIVTRDRVVAATSHQSTLVDKMSSQTLGQLECRPYVYVIECQSASGDEHGLFPSEKSTMYT